MSTLLHLYSHNPFLYPEHTLIVKKIIFEGRKASLTHISVGRSCRGNLIRQKLLGKRLDQFLCRTVWSVSE